MDEPVPRIFVSRIGNFMWSNGTFLSQRCDHCFVSFMAHSSKARVCEVFIYRCLSLFSFQQVRNKFWIFQVGKIAHKGTTMCICGNHTITQSAPSCLGMPSILPGNFGSNCTSPDARGQEKSMEKIHHNQPWLGTITAPNRKLETRLRPNQPPQVTSCACAFFWPPYRYRNSESTPQAAWRPAMPCNIRVNICGLKHSRHHWCMCFPWSGPQFCCTIFNIILPTP